MTSDACYRRMMVGEEVVTNCGWEARSCPQECSNSPAMLVGIIVGWPAHIFSAGWRPPTRYDGIHPEMLATCTGHACCQYQEPPEFRNTLGMVTNGVPTWDWEPTANSAAHEGGSNTWQVLSNWSNPNSGEWSLSIIRVTVEVLCMVCKHVYIWLYMYYVHTLYNVHTLYIYIHYTECAIWIGGLL